MQNQIDHFLTSAIDWLFRKRSTGLALVRSGGVIVLATLGISFIFSISIPLAAGQLKLDLNWNGSTPEFLVIVALALATLLIILGAALIVRDELRLSRKRLIAIELRGLRDTSGSPLKDAIPGTIGGRREQILVNIRRTDGKILEPEEALAQVSQLPHTIAQFESGADRSDTKFFAAGLAPVPFSFLMGVLLDDEGSIDLMDWDRAAESWRTLNASDDNKRFNVSETDVVGAAVEVVLEVAVSYPTNKEAIARTFPGLPVVTMKMDDLATDAHWSEGKQAALAQQFFDTARSFCGSGVKRIHLVLAAPNSIVLRFGRVYDKRNLPEIVVYQYENGQTPAYPWGVLMPTSGVKVATIVHT